MVREGEGKGEKQWCERETSISEGMCPDWELDPRPLGLCEGTQPTEPD